MRYYAIAAIMAFLAAAVPVPSIAADLSARTVEVSPEAAEQAAQHYVSQRAVLFMIRATFGVTSWDDFDALLAQDVRAVGAEGPTEAAAAQLRRDLLAEGGYFLISLRYLIESGGANWPQDREEASYANDARVRIDALLDRLFDAVEAGADILPIMQEADEVFAWTEGYREVTGDLDHFAGRDDTVATVFAQGGARSDT